MAECIIARGGGSGGGTPIPPPDYGIVNIRTILAGNNGIIRPAVYCNDGGNITQYTSDINGYCEFKVKSGQATFNYTYGTGYIDVSNSSTTSITINAGETKNLTMYLPNTYPRINYTRNSSVRFLTTNYVWVWCYGGGGGGYGDWRGTNVSYGGGGGGYSWANVPVNHNTTYRITVGAGGKGSWCENNTATPYDEDLNLHIRHNGESGGTSSFGTLVSATGGGGGSPIGPGVGGIGSTLNGGNGKSRNYLGNILSISDQFNMACGGGGCDTNADRDMNVGGINSWNNEYYVLHKGGVPLNNIDGQTTWGGNGGDGGGWWKRYNYSTGSWQYGLSSATDGEGGNNYAAGGGGGGGLISQGWQYWNRYADGGDGGNGLVSIYCRR